jgi:acyl carrier protein
MIDLVFKKVSKILEEIIDIDCAEITLETELTTENGIKTIDVARLVIECEKKFKIIIHDEDVHSFRCVSDIVEYINRIKSDS